MSDPEDLPSSDPRYWAAVSAYRSKEVRVRWKRSALMIATAIALPIIMLFVGDGG